MCIRFLKLYCHPAVYGRQRNGLKDCRTLRVQCDDAIRAVSVILLLFVHETYLSRRIETTVCPRGDGDLEAMSDRPYGTQYYMVRLIIGTCVRVE